MNKYKAILFDLDGTLLDTVPGLAKAMNEVLHKHKFAPRSIEEYKTFIGNGIKALVEQSVPPNTDPNLLSIMYKEKTKLYSIYWKEGTSLFPGIAQMLTDLSEHTISLAIFSNKEDFFTQQIAKEFLSSWKFEVISGRTESIPKKPNPLGVQLILNKFPYSPGEWLFVGDKDADVETANNAGIDSVWVSWGYQVNQPKACTWVIHEPSELLKIVQT